MRRLLLVLVLALSVLAVVPAVALGQDVPSTDVADSPAELPARALLDQMAQGATTPIGFATGALSQDCDSPAAKVPAALDKPLLDGHRLQVVCIKGKVGEIVDRDGTMYTRPQPGGKIRDPSQDPKSGEKPRYIDYTSEMAQAAVDVASQLQPGLTSGTTCTDSNHTDLGQVTYPDYVPFTGYIWHAWDFHRTFSGAWESGPSGLESVVLENMNTYGLNTGPAIHNNVAGEVREATYDIMGQRNPNCVKPPNQGGWHQSEGDWDGTNALGHPSAKNSGHVYMGVASNEQEGPASLLPTCYRGYPDYQSSPQPWAGTVDGRNTVSAARFRNWVGPNGEQCLSGGAIGISQIRINFFGNCSDPNSIECYRAPVESDAMLNNYGVIWCSESASECRDDLTTRGYAYSMEEATSHEMLHDLGHFHDLGNWPEGPAYGGYRHNLMSPEMYALRPDVVNGAAPQRIGRGDVIGQVGRNPDPTNDALYPCDPPACPYPFAP